MTKPSRYAYVGVLLSVLVAPSAPWAATYDVNGFRISISDAIPASEKIRGAIAIQRWSPMVTESTGKAAMDRFVVEERLAVITSGFQERDLSLSQLEAEYHALVAAFETLAERANRPELRYVGFIFQGCSIHGARSMSQGFGNPDRTIAAISFCGRNYALYDLLPRFTPMMPELSYPHLQVSTGNDSDRVMWNDNATREVREEGRGLWTSSLHPALGHCDPARDGLAYELLWLREVIKARVPQPIPDGPYTLNKLTDTDGWLGDYSPVRARGADGAVWASGYRFANAQVFAASSIPPEDVGHYIWFPTEVAAREWKNYSDTGTCCLGLTAPEPDPSEPDPVEPPDTNEPPDTSEPPDTQEPSGPSEPSHPAEPPATEPPGTHPTVPPTTGIPSQPSEPPADGAPSTDAPDAPRDPNETRDPASSQGCSAAGASLLTALAMLVGMRRKGAKRRR